jgi:hypothetical protein
LNCTQSNLRVYECPGDVPKNSGQMSREKRDIMKSGIARQRRLACYGVKACTCLVNGSSSGTAYLQRMMQHEVS